MLDNDTETDMFKRIFFAVLFIIAMFDYAKADEFFRHWIEGHNEIRVQRVEIPGYWTYEQRVVELPGHYESRVQLVTVPGKFAFVKVWIPGERRVETVPVWHPATFQDRQVSVWIPGYYVGEVEIGFSIWPGWHGRTRHRR